MASSLETSRKVTEVTPANAAETAAVLAAAKAQGFTVAVGRRAANDAPLTKDLVQVSLAGLTGPIDHCAGDLVATIPAGWALTDANAMLARGGQWLPLDPPAAARSRIGAMVAANDSGPRRHRYGTPRDLIIGIELALTDGRVAKAGGRVVKNVAGYDLARLMCGSFGSLGLITSATFKLAPLPASSRTVVINAEDRSTLMKMIEAVSMAALTPSAIELQAPPYRLLVRFETTRDAAEHQAQAVVDLFGRHSAVTAISGDEEDQLWSTYESSVWAGSGTFLKVGVLTTDVATVLATLEQLAGTGQFEYHVGGRAAAGVLGVRLEGDRQEDHVACVERLRQAITARGGHVRVERSDVLNSSAVDRWGNIGDALALMRAVKARFDPNGILNPGSGPGGL